MASLAIPAFVAAGWIALRTPPVPYEARFRAESALTGDVLRDVRATGHLEAESTVDIGAEISGRIVSVEVDYNDRIAKGQVLARFDRTALEAQLTQAEAAVAAASASLEQARIDREQAARKRARSDELFRQGFEAAEAHEAAQAAQSVATARVAALQSEVDLRRAAAALARTNLGYTVVRSPIDGVVISRAVDPGQTVVSAFQTSVLFTIAADLSRMRVIAAIDEADVAEVLPGKPAEFTVNAWPDRTFTGTVVAVRNAPEVLQDVVTYGAEIEVENGDLALKPGMTASVRVRTAESRNALTVPNSALRFSPPNEPRSKDPGVWVMRDGSLSRVTVRAGVTDGEITSVESTDLHPGDVVVVDLSAAGRTVYGAPGS